MCKNLILKTLIILLKYYYCNRSNPGNTKLFALKYKIYCFSGFAVVVASAAPYSSFQIAPYFSTKILSLSSALSKSRLSIARPVSSFR